MKTVTLKPMLAATLGSVDDIQFPVWCSPKIDGIRCLIGTDGKAVTRSLKPIPNNHIRKMLSIPELAALDGELIPNNVSGFNNVSSAIMRGSGEPEFTYFVFDNFFVDAGFEDRYKFVVDYVQKLPEKIKQYVCPVIHVYIQNKEDFLKFEQKCLEVYEAEGVMIRHPDGPYKMGRSGKREGYLLKWKHFQDDEAEVTGFVELMHNANEAKKDLLGHTERSHRKENLVPRGMLGALLVRDVKTGIEFKIGTGFDEATRKEIWNNKDAYMGKLAKYKHQPHGAKEAPRFPSFQGFRDLRDM